MIAKANQQVSEGRLRAGIAIYFALLAAAVAVYLVHDLRQPNGWSLAEWLINYRGGFVRRGLVGEGLWRIAAMTHLSVFALAAALEWLAYAMTLWGVWRLSRGVRWSWAWVALLLSPATLVLPVLDPPDAVKKEFLLFAGMAWMIGALLRGRWRGWEIALALTVFTQVMVLTQEASLVTLPYVFTAVLIAEADTRLALRRIAVPVVLLLPSAWMVAAHAGSAETAQAVCVSLGGTWPGEAGSLCSGAIAWLAKTPRDAANEVASRALAHHYFALYVPCLLLAMLPIVLVLRKVRGREVRWVLAASGLAWVLSFALFRVGVDWGRWIEMHCVCMMLLLMMIDRDGREHALAWSARKALAVALYVTCWTMPAVKSFGNRLGYPGLVWYMHDYRNANVNAGS